MIRIRQLVLAAFLFATLTLSSVSLTDGGHIETGNHVTREGFVETHPCAGGIIAIEHHDHQPVELWLDGNAWTFRQVIDPVFSTNRRWLAFSTCDAVRVLDTATGTMHEYPASDEFAIDDRGNPVLWNARLGEISYRNRVTLINEIVRGLIVHGDEIYIQTQRSLVRLDDDRTIFRAKGSLHDVAWVDGNLYTSVKSHDGYRLIRVEDGATIESRPAPDSRAGRTHQPIPSPLHYGEESYPHPIGNTYLEIQDYGGTPYLHPGVDFLGVPNENVYSVQDGVVKAILTTGGELYWRVAIALEDTDDESEGYLYAHLNENSITVAVGDSVHAGDVVGTLVGWPVANFHHCHYARVRNSGSVWNGDWWTTDDPLRDTYDHLDTEAPVFEDVAADQICAFRRDGNYMDPYELEGEVDIIAHAHDIINSDWRCTINRIGYRLSALSNPDSILVDQISFTFDYPCDDYGEGTYEAMCLSTIFCRDDQYFSNGNYDTREYYYILSHADADSAMTENDADQSFDTTQFPDGFYNLEVWAEDGAGNVTTEPMLIMIDNNPDEPPAFIDMPANMIIHADSVHTLSLWDHVEDDNTPDAELAFDFSADNPLLEWSFDDSTGVLSLWHSALDTQAAPMLITVTDDQDQSSDRTINFILEMPQAVQGEVVPALFSLSCSPNPFNPSTTIRFSIPEAAMTRLDIYNLRGQRIRTLVSEKLKQGPHAVTWDGTDENHRTVGSGVYLYKLQAGSRSSVEKMILLK